MRTPGWLQQFWRDESGDVVENLAIIVTVCLGLSALLVTLTVAVENSGRTFKETIPGVTLQ